MNSEEHRKELARLFPPKPWHTWAMVGIYGLAFLFAMLVLSLQACNYQLQEVPKKEEKR